MTRKQLLGLSGNYDFTTCINELMSFCSENGIDEVMENFIDTDFLDELVQNRMSNGGWQGVACMLDGIDYLNDDYYIMDGYGNMQEITINDIECVISDILNSYEEYLEEDEEEEEEE